MARSLDGDSNADHIGTPNRGLGLALVAIRGNAKLYPCALDHIRASPPSDGVLAEAGISSNGENCCCLGESEP